MDTRAIAQAAERLRTTSLTLLRALADEELEVAATPGWTVADVFRHLASSDRDVVLGKHVKDFLPSVSDDEFEARNDRALERLRSRSRTELEDELEVWGARLRWIIRSSPARLGDLRIPTIFGTVPLSWFSALRIYDEWVHQWDVMQALDRGVPPMDDLLRDLLAEFQLRALPAKPLKRLPQRPGVVEVDLADVLPPNWRFDLWTRSFGARVTTDATVVVRTDVPTWTLLAADRIDWRQAEAAGDLAIDGDDRGAAEVLLEVVRVV
ncbi:MAG TPA: maleylpyruvate isomerase family mycothiol-dependent enzyme [Nitriliruptorales bacterium]